MKNKKQVGKALGRVPSGLFIMTVKHDDKEDAVLASWVNQCAFDPPALTVSLGVTRPARLLVEASGTFIINVLGKENNDLMKHFFKSPEPGESVFEGLKTAEGIGGAKILKDAVSYLECELVDQAHTGDHILYVGEIVGGRTLKGGDPATHIRDNGFNY